MRRWIRNFPLAELPTLLSFQGGTLIGTRKGRGQGIKGAVNPSSKIRGVSWFTTFGEAETSGGSDSP